MRSEIRRLGTTTHSNVFEQTVTASICYDGKVPRELSFPRAVFESAAKRQEANRRAYSTSDRLQANIERGLSMETNEKHLRTLVRADEKISQLSLEERRRRYWRSDAGRKALQNMTKFAMNGGLTWEATHTVWSTSISRVPSAKWMETWCTSLSALNSCLISYPHRAADMLFFGWDNIADVGGRGLDFEAWTNFMLRPTILETVEAYETIAAKGLGLTSVQNMYDEYQNFVRVWDHLIQLHTASTDQIHRSMATYLQSLRDELCNMTPEPGQSLYDLRSLYAHTKSTGNRMGTLSIKEREERVRLAAARQPAVNALTDATQHQLAQQQMQINAMQQQFQQATQNNSSHVTPTGAPTVTVTNSPRSYGVMLFRFDDEPALKNYPGGQSKFWLDSLSFKQIDAITATTAPDRELAARASSLRPFRDRDASPRDTSARYGPFTACYADKAGVETINFRVRHPNGEWKNDACAACYYLPSPPALPDGMERHPEWFKYRSTKDGEKRGAHPPATCAKNKVLAFYLGILDKVLYCPPVGQPSASPIDYASIDRKPKGKGAGGKGRGGGGANGGGRALGGMGRGGGSGLPPPLAP